MWVRNLKRIPYFCSAVTNEIIYNIVPFELPGHGLNNMLSPIQYGLGDVKFIMYYIDKCDYHIIAKFE